MQTEAIGQKAVKLLEPGDMFGDYTVEKLLGKGGMGAVYLVHSPDGERYAVKVMFPDMVKKGSDYRRASPSSWYGFSSMHTTGLDGSYGLS